MNCYISLSFRCSRICMVTTFFNSSTLCPLCIWLKPDHPGTCWISEYCWTGRVRIQASSFSYELAIISLSGVYNFPWEFLALRGLVSHSLFQFFWGSCNSDSASKFSCLSHFEVTRTSPYLVHNEMYPYLSASIRWYRCCPQRNKCS